LFERQKEFPISDKEDRATMRDRQSREFEGSQQKLRANIAQSKRLVDEADKLIRRHRGECDTADKAAKNAKPPA
jgi:hypothetical protein